MHFVHILVLDVYCCQGPEKKEIRGSVRKGQIEHEKIPLPSCNVQIRIVRANSHQRATLFITLHSFLMEADKCALPEHILLIRWVFAMNTAE